MHSTELNSPVGPLTLGAANGLLVEVRFGSLADGQPDARQHAAAMPPVLQRCREQLEEYFGGLRTEFDLPLAFGGTDFQREVWQALQSIPYGCVETYGELAARIGRPQACRAVGQANHRNPLAIIIPCHRVIGAGGQLTGYGGGLDRKQRLLDLERDHCGEMPLTVTSADSRFRSQVAAGLN